MSIEVVRSEEELRTGVRRTARERVVVRTRVVSEEVTMTFQVRKHVVDIEQEPLDEAIAAAEGLTLERGPESLEVVLWEERPTVTMELVPVERIRITREVERRDEEVQARLSRERVEITTGAVDQQVGADQVAGAEAGADQVAGAEATGGEAGGRVVGGGAAGTT
jgi:stress response protein YsnF